ncbi:hypothetical protein HK100_003324 [Physocladia obscura]|uniref:NTF2 domain-containing protein n=1 Tax=Physocladia obscura TaxID=109957 RepID=A0AAD5T6S8_9FUNG|nr:hypothetical protein HK100_003324 [Physocladia obscura]
MICVKKGTSIMSVDQIAKGFTDFYYNAFDTNRAGLAPLYRDVSMLTYEDKQFVGAQNIVNHLASLPVQRIKHLITKCDAQPSHPTQGSILITFDDSPAPMAFVQTFNLYPEGTSNYFVYNGWLLLYGLAVCLYAATNANGSVAISDVKRIVKLNVALVQHVKGMMLGPVIPTYARCLHYHRISHAVFTRSLVLDVHHDGRASSKSALAPVIVFIYGGAWSSGSKEIYAPLAYTLQTAGYIVVVPNYSLHPNGLVEEMLDDVADALVWTEANILSYGGDPKNISIMGHSAGAHLASLVLIHNLNSVTQNRLCPMNNEYTGQYFLRPLTRSLPRISAVILLAGVYNIAQHFQFEAQRGLEEVSAMARAMGSTRASFDARSPVEILRNLNHLEVDTIDRNLALRTLLPANWLLLHGSSDTTVPVRESEQLYEVLRGLEFENTRLVVLPRISHAVPVLELMSLDSDYTNLFISLLQQTIP